MSRLVFLGTGGDAFTVGKGLRAAGGIILKVSGHQFHLDPGPGSLLVAKQAGVNLRETVGVLVSSAHLLHAGDLNAVLSAMTYGGLDTHGVVLAAPSVIEGGEGMHPMLQPFFASHVERVVNLRDVPRVAINDVEIRVLPAKHTDSDAVGFQIVSGHERISYTGDTSLTDDVKEAHRGATILIACLTATAEDQRQSHLSQEDVVALTKHVQPKLLVITHFSYDLLKKDILAVGREIGASVSCPVVVAEDGLVLDTQGYA